jgi:hypothetical protein
MVVYMTGEALEQSLACVLADPLVDEFVVVDNGSQPQEAERLRAGRRDARVVLRPATATSASPGRQPGRAPAARRPAGLPQPRRLPAAGCIAELVREIDGAAVPCLVGGRC